MKILPQVFLTFFLLAEASKRNHSKNNSEATVTIQYTDSLEATLTTIDADSTNNVAPAQPYSSSEHNFVPAQPYSSSEHTLNERDTETPELSPAEMHHTTDLRKAAKLTKYDAVNLVDEPENEYYSKKEHNLNEGNAYTETPELSPAEMHHTTDPRKPAKLTKYDAANLVEEPENESYSRKEYNLNKNNAYTETPNLSPAEMHHTTDPSKTAKLIKYDTLDLVEEPENDSYSKKEHNLNEINAYTETPELSPSEMHYTTDPSKAAQLTKYDTLDLVEDPKNDSYSRNLSLPFFERMERANKTIAKWTTCELFLNNSPPLDMKTLMDTDWIVFYFWVEHEDESYNVRFQKPTPTLLDRFKVGLKQFQEDSKPAIVNWTNAELWMETTIDLSALFVRTDTPGMYQFIPTLLLDSDQFYSVNFALKLVEPGYLGIVNCDHRTGFSLAPTNKIPEPDKALAAALSLGFYNELGRSYNETVTPIVQPELRNNDDAEDDAEMDLEQSEGLLAIF